MISIAMATYNGEQFLDEQLRSLNEQVKPPREMVVCDDQSTDRTRDLLTRFARKASFPVKLFTNDRRLGWRENFLQAAKLCSSEYIAFCDQDDIWLKEKLAVVESYLRRNQCMLLQHGFRLIDDWGNVITEELDWEYLELHEVPWRFSYGLTQVFHRSLLEFTDLWELSEDHFDPGQLEWAMINGSGSFPPCLDTHFRSKKFSCTTDSIPTALLDGGRQPTKSSVVRLSTWCVRSPIRTSRRRNGKN